MIVVKCSRHGRATSHPSEMKGQPDRDKRAAVSGVDKAQLNTSRASTDPRLSIQQHGRSPHLLSSPFHREKTSFGHRETQSGLRDESFLFHPRISARKITTIQVPSIRPIFLHGFIIYQELYPPWFLIVNSTYPLSRTSRTIQSFSDYIASKIQSIPTPINFIDFHYSRPLFLNLFTYWFRELPILQSYQRSSIIYPITITYVCPTTISKFRPCKIHSYLL